MLKSFKRTVSRFIASWVRTQEASSAIKYDQSNTLVILTEVDLLEFDNVICRSLIAEPNRLRAKSGDTTSTMSLLRLPLSAYLAIRVLRK